MAAPRPREISAITGYHAHVYYDAATKPVAARLRKRLRDRFDVALGRWRDRNVGPHPSWMFQVGFGPGAFDEIVPWLALNREGLDILIHPETGDALADHTDNAIWLGRSRRIRRSAFR